MNAKIFKSLRRHFSKNLWQSLEWSNFQVSINREIIFFGDDEAIGLGVIKKLPLGFSYLEVPRGPLGITDKNFWKDLKSITKQYKCVFTSISPEKKMSNLPKLSFKSIFQIYPQKTLCLDLNLSEEKLLKQMKPKGRYNIRVAQRHKVKIFESNDIEKFYNLLQETTNRDNFSAHSLSYYETMINSLKNNAKLYLASIIDEDNESEEIIAGGVFTFLDNICTYYYGASSNKHREKMAPYLLQWQIISEAKKQGYKNYDFLGIANSDKKSDPLTGVTRFKKQFGGEEITYPAAQDIIYRPFIYAIYRFIKLVKTIW